MQTEKVRKIYEGIANGTITRADFSDTDCDEPSVPDQQVRIFTKKSKLTLL